MTTSSLDTNQPIYISEESREYLFKHILEEEQLGCEDIDGLYDYMFSAENLEGYCLGATSRADYAYKKISKLLRKEYEDWKVKENYVLSPEISIKKDTPIYKPELTLKKMKDDDYSDKMSVGQFIDKILEGFFIDYDGYCAFIIDKENEEYRVINATYSIDKDMIYIKDADNDTLTTDLLNFCYSYNIRKIIWFNK